MESPDPPSEEQEAGEELKWELIRELDASNPSDQFDAQVQTEYEGMCQGVRDRTRRVTPGASLLKAAETNVRQRWVEQGIWRDEWSGDRPWPRQKHEEAIDPKPVSETTSPLSGGQQTQTGMVETAVPPAARDRQRDPEASRGASPTPSPSGVEPGQASRGAPPTQSLLGGVGPTQAPRGAPPGPKRVPPVSLGQTGEPHPLTAARPGVACGSVQASRGAPPTQSPVRGAEPTQASRGAHLGQQQVPRQPEEPHRARAAHLGVPHGSVQASRGTSPTQSPFDLGQASRGAPPTHIPGPTQAPRGTHLGQQRFGGATTTSSPTEAQPGRTTFTGATLTQAPRDASRNVYYNGYSPIIHPPHGQSSAPPDLVPAAFAAGSPNGFPNHRSMALSSRICPGCSSPIPRKVAPERGAAPSIQFCPSCWCLIPRQRE